MMIMAESSNEDFYYLTYSPTYMRYKKSICLYVPLIARATKKERWIRPTRWLDIFVFLKIRFMPVS